jgi:Fe-S oxidoreductase
VHEALDLCLACKGCASDCPTGVDMATYKAEVLHQTYRRRPRPRTHYSLGWLPRWARLGARAPAAANALVRAPVLRSLVPRLAGTDPRRPVPRLAPRTFGDWFADRARPDPSSAPNGPVLLWVDTFTEHFVPDVGSAAVSVLEAAGYEVRLAAERLCCGLTYVTTGQLRPARRVLRRTLPVLAAAVDAGVPVVGLEPSCTATLRSDARELVPGPAADAVASGTRTLAELLTATEGWEPRRLDGRPLVAQPHCHQHAVLGWEADARLLAAAGADVTRVGGCCGLAGSFGAEAGHYDVSVTVAEQALLPAVRHRTQGAAVLADGFSCRTQLADLAGVRGLHLAQLLAGAEEAPAGGPVAGDGGGRLRRRRRAR